MNDVCVCVCVCHVFTANILLHPKSLQIYDSYADINGSFWSLCKLADEIYRDSSSLLLPSPIHITSYLNSLHIRQKTTDSNYLKLNGTVRVQPGNSTWLRFTLMLTAESLAWVTPCQLSLAMPMQIAAKLTNLLFVVVVFFCPTDFNYKYKLATGNDEVESCDPNPCRNGGKCISNGNVNRCQCIGHFTGR